jgi:PAS domain S-box-containing protein
MKQEIKTKQQLFDEIEGLRTRLKEAEETLIAVRNGEVDAIIVSGKQGEQVFTLPGAERVFRVLIETMNEGAASLNQEGLIIYCNQRFAEMIKTPLEKVIGAPLRRFILPSDIPVFDSLMDKRLQENRKGEVALANSDGTALPALLSISALQKDGADIRNIIVTDLTEQKHVEEELRRHRDNLEERVRDRTDELETANQHLQEEIAGHERTVRSLAEKEARLRLLVETIPDMIWLKDADGIYMTCNKMFEQFFGASESAIVGKTDYDFVSKELADVFREHDRKAMAEGKPSSTVEEITFASDGHRALMNTIKTPMYDAAGKLIGALGIGRDITEYQKLEEQLRHAQKLEGIGTLAGGIAHDFNNILSAIIGYGHVTLMKMPKNDPLRLNIEHILESADRAAALTQSLLAFSRKQITNRKPVELNSVIRRVEKFLVRIIGEDVAVRLTLTEGALTIFADAGQLEQVFMNLATNARDAMPNGGSFTIETSSRELDSGFVSAHGYGKPGSYAMICATDTGMGMTEETKQKIFEPFFTTKEVGKGTGLGLAMVYGILKQHEGFINVYSEPGRGTTLRIYLPLIKAEAADEKIAVTYEYPKGGTETILLAEDDASLRRLSMLVLEQMGYTVIVANDGEDAVTKFMENQDRIQLLLFDIIMPKKNGREAYEEIRKVMPDVPVLFASGYSPDMLSEKSLIPEGAAIVYKPSSPLDLSKKVREVLDRK